jgi:hypothetical protein
LIADPSDPKALEFLARRFEMAESPTVSLSRNRGEGDADGIEPLYPRGNVRMEDLTDLRIDIGEAWNAKGKLEVRAGGKVLYSADFEPANLRTIAPIPDAVKALRAGDEFEWGFYPEKGEPTVAKCKVVAHPARIAEMAADLKDQDPAVRSNIIARAMLEEGLCCAAYREAKGLADAGKADERVLGVMQRALEALDLEDTALWADLIRCADELGG